MFMNKLIVLMVMDVYSRYLWYRVLPNKSGLMVKNAFKDIVEEAGDKNLESFGLIMVQNSTIILSRNNYKNMVLNYTQHVMREKRLWRKEV